MFPMACRYLCGLSTAPAVAQIKLGFNMPLTGFAAADGKSALDGAELAVAQANAAGDVNGEKIEASIVQAGKDPTLAAAFLGLH
jgi:branched-chain amino acid transport system substrate-binding protein